MEETLAEHEHQQYSDRGCRELGIHEALLDGPTFASNSKGRRVFGPDSNTS
jgi:hypothetical protein